MSGEAADIFRLKKIFHALMLVVLLGGLSTCGDDGDRLVVDFDRTVAGGRPGGAPTEGAFLRAAVAAMVSPKETFDLYRRLLEYVSRRVGKTLQFIQRRTYAEINELLGKGHLDVAFLCSGPYATDKTRFGFEPLAVPRIHGTPFYQSFLIVRRDSPHQRLEDLRGGSFAFTDPLSNTGKLVPTAWLAELGERPETFFRETIFTYSHDNSILAVARGLVDGAAVDGLVWEYYKEKSPELAARTQVIRKSEDFGNPPLVASRFLPPAERQALKDILLTMHQDPQGQKILAELLIDRFVPLEEQWYDGIRRLYERLSPPKEAGHGVQNP